MSAEIKLKATASRIKEAVTVWSQPAPDQPPPSFNDLALKVFALQFELNVPYQRFCLHRGVTPETCTHWTHVPPVPTEAFKYSEMSCLAPGARSCVFHSSGTTAQQPSRHYHCAQSLALYEASLMAWFAKHLLPENSSGSLKGKGPELVILTPGPSEAPNSSLVHMFETVGRQLRPPGPIYVGFVDGTRNWQVDAQAALREFEARGNRPLLVVGTAFNFVHLLERLEHANRAVALPARSRVLETGGYKGRSRFVPRQELHQMITRVLGVKPGHLVSEYGMSELSSQAYDRAVDSPASAPRRFHFPPWTRATVVSPEDGEEVADGETGLIRIHDLANVFSVMAIQTEDLAIRRPDGFELLGRLPHSESRGCSLLSPAEALPA